MNLALASGEGELSLNCVLSMERDARIFLLSLKCMKVSSWLGPTKWALKKHTSRDGCLQNLPAPRPVLPCLMSQHTVVLNSCYCQTSPEEE